MWRRNNDLALPPLRYCISGFALFNALSDSATPQETAFRSPGRGDRQPAWRFFYPAATRSVLNVPQSGFFPFPSIQGTQNNLASAQTPPRSKIPL